MLINNIHELQEITTVTVLQILKNMERKFLRKMERCTLFDGQYIERKITQ